MLRLSEFFKGSLYVYMIGFSFYVYVLVLNGYVAKVLDTGRGIVRLFYGGLLVGHVGMCMERACKIRMRDDDDKSKCY